MGVQKGGIALCRRSLEGKSQVCSLDSLNFIALLLLYYYFSVQKKEAKKKAKKS